MRGMFCRAKTMIARIGCSSERPSGGRLYSNPRLLFPHKSSHHSEHGIVVGPSCRLLAIQSNTSSGDFPVYNANRVSRPTVSLRTTSSSSLVGLSYACCATGTQKCPGRLCSNEATSASSDRRPRLRIGARHQSARRPGRANGRLLPRPRCHSTDVLHVDSH